MIVTIDGEQEPGFQVHLGGGLASADRDEAGPRPHRPRPQGHRRPTCPTSSSASCAASLDQREAGETFSGWAHRVDEEELR